MTRNISQSQIFATTILKNNACVNLEKEEIFDLTLTCWWQN